MRVSAPDVFGRAGAWLVTAAQSRDADGRAVEEHDVPPGVLMENAGRAAALVLQRLFPAGRVAVLAGGGNNGGDAAVLARTLLVWGRDVLLVPAGDVPSPTLRHGWDLPLAGPEAIISSGIIVDGLLGTGATGAPRGQVLELVRAANASGRPILSLDLPSGVDATTGKVPGEAVSATATVTFGWAKLGLLLHPARDHCGRLVVVDIGFPPIGPDVAGEIITPGRTVPRLPRRAAAAHKGDSGRLLLLAGRPGMAGAAAIAGRAAARTGAGLVRIASSPENRVILQTLVPEATFVAYDDLPVHELQTMSALVAGPGLGTDANARTVLEAALAATAGRPALLDADALNLFADDAELLAGVARERPLLITPHPAELGRLLGRRTEEITTDAPAAATEAAERFGCVVLLKGQPSLVAERGRPLLVNAGGSSDVAVAGMGDQLAGVAGALLAAGLEPREAASAALFLSSRAADLAGRGRALGPGDVTDHLHAAFADPGPAASSLDLPFVTFDQPARR